MKYIVETLELQFGEEIGRELADFDSFEEAHDYMLWMLDYMSIPYTKFYTDMECAGAENPTTQRELKIEITETYVNPDYLPATQRRWVIEASSDIPNTEHFIEKVPYGRNPQAFFCEYLTKYLSDVYEISKRQAKDILEKGYAGISFETTTTGGNATIDFGVFKEFYELRRAS